jgi:AraC-like DNA-binding protein
MVIMVSTIQNGLLNNSPQSPPVLDECLEKHYSPEDVSSMWGISPRTVRRLFANEPGIIELGQPDSIKKRRYLTIRIPESVLMRVHRRLKKAG